MADLRQIELELAGEGAPTDDQVQVGVTRKLVQQRRQQGKVERLRFVEAVQARKGRIRLQRRLRAVLPGRQRQVLVTQSEIGLVVRVLEEDVFAILDGKDGQFVIAEHLGAVVERVQLG